jgi:hypothetical protein
MSGWNQTISAGTSDKGLSAVDGSNDSQATSSSSWKEFFVPAGEQFNSANIRVGDPQPTSTDPTYIYENFLWCAVNPDADPNATILAFNVNGKSAGVAKEAGESLGFFKSTTDGKSVVLWARE